ncbi:MAG: hypothetical protein RQ723_12065 [Desulfuromonadales bacterium]|nr:hypothetical protein [Desulfuromonadales bacterium]
MARIGDIEGRIRLDATQFKRGVNQSVSAASRLRGRLNSLAATAAKLATAFIGIGAAIAGGKFLKASIKAFATQEDAVASLRSALIQTGNAGENALERLSRSASKLQRQTRAADEALIQATATLSLLAPALKVDELEQAQKAMIGLAATFTGGDIESAAVAIGKTLGGTVDLLARWGVAVGTAGDATERLGRLMKSAGRFFRVAQAQADTLAGRAVQLKNAIGDLQESVGSLIADMLDATNRARGLRGVVEDMTDSIDRAALQTAAWGRQIAIGVTAPLRILGNVGTAVMFALVTATLAAKASFLEAAIGARFLFNITTKRLPTEGIAGLVVALEETQRKIDTAKGLIVQDFRDIGDAIRDVETQSIRTAAAMAGIRLGPDLSVAGAVAAGAAFAGAAGGGSPVTVPARPAGGGALDDILSPGLRAGTIQRGLFGDEFQGLDLTRPPRVEPPEIPQPDIPKFIREFEPRAKEMGDDMSRILKASGINAAESLVEGMILGLNNFGDILRRFIAGFVSKFVVAQFTQSLGIGSPSRVAMGWGMDTGRGYAIGLAASEPLVAGGARSLALSPQAALAGAGGGGAGGVQVLNRFEIQALDSADVERGLRQNAGAILKIMSDGIKSSAALHRGVVTGR